MSLIKRLSATVTSSVERVVSKVENHDAIIDAALKDTRNAAARSRVRLARVQKDGKSLHERHAQLLAAAECWAKRARDIAATDQSRALECVRRRETCLAKAVSLEGSIAQHKALESKVADNLKQIEARIGEVSQQRNLMRSRQSVAEAMRVIQNVEGSSGSAIEETFDRWEINLGESEILAASAAPVDELEAGFASSEEDERLRAALGELLAGDAQAAP
ncbi:MAG: PspA/IM30 family protein [Gammaproteobacteria bacterium]